MQQKQQAWKPGTEIQDATRLLLYRSTAEISDANRLLLVHTDKILEIADSMQKNSQDPETQVQQALRILQDATAREGMGSEIDSDDEIDEFSEHSSEIDTESGSENALKEGSDTSMRGFPSDWDSGDSSYIHNRGKASVQPNLAKVIESLMKLVALEEVKEQFLAIT